MSVTRAVKVRRIARRELWTTLTRPGFIISTILVPLLPLVFLGMSGLFVPERIIGGPVPARVGIVDRTGLLDLSVLEPGAEQAGAVAEKAKAPAKGAKAPAARPPLPPGVRLPPLAKDALKGLSPALVVGGAPVPSRDHYVGYESLAAARRDLLAGKLTGLVVIDKGWLTTGKATAYQVRWPDHPSPVSPFGAGLAHAIRRSLLTGRLPPAILHRTLGAVSDLDTHVLDPKGHPVPEKVVSEDVRRFLVPTVAALFLSVALFAGAGYLLLGLSEEKENRILELLLASVTPDELLAGKLIGIGGAGLVQFALWVGLIAVPVAVLAPMIGISLTQIAWATGFFLAGYALFGALMLGVGAVADTARHAQQLSGIFTLAAMIPFMFSFVIIQWPNGLFARVLTFIPVTAPITVMFRMSAGNLSTVELAGALAILVTFAWLALKGAGRLFRVSLLLYGNRASPAQIWRWLREGG